MVYTFNLYCFLLLLQTKQTIIFSNQVPILPDLSALLQSCRSLAQSYSRRSCCFYYTTERHIGMSKYLVGTILCVGHNLFLSVIGIVMLSVNIWWGPVPRSLYIPAALLTVILLAVRQGSPPSNTSVFPKSLFLLFHESTHDKNVGKSCCFPTHFCTIAWHTITLWVYSGKMTKKLEKFLFVVSTPERWKSKKFNWIHRSSPTLTSGFPLALTKFKIWSPICLKFVLA